ncbi:hypothetical protein JRI60_02130 [Archangium violaceum]|uniref:hypothetical protein n=1 Tax=Archangium violaceum TaxID=83451 RepID=UPI00194F8FD4|nr:hypothetical protein [Archangium violaceum]QRN97904.1 hypothetical protein JRI60_02130 [Archangium violaceum]
MPAKKPSLSLPAAVPAVLTQKLENLRFSSIASVQEGVRAVKLQRAELAPSIARLYADSERKAMFFAEGVAANWRDDREAEEDAEPLIDWARSAGSQQRRMMVHALKQQNRGIFVVHHVGGMSREDARAFMKDYFEAGGSLDDVAEWLQRAGNVLRNERPAGQPGTDGLFSKAWNWVKGAVKTVTDAVKAAGKSLADAMGKVLSWTAAKIADFVDALLDAGRKVGEILTEALAKGADALKKFVRAVLDAGRAVADVLAWAATKAAATLKDVVDAILQAGRAVAQLVAEAAKAGEAAIRATVRALVELGRKVREVLAAAGAWSTAALEQLFRGLKAAGSKLAEVAGEVARFTGTAIRRMVEGLYKAYLQARDILVAFMKDQLSTLRMVLEGLLAAGLQLGKAITSIVQDVAEQFRKGFFQGLIALGKSPFLIMKEALATTGAVAALAFATLLDVLGGHRPLTDEEKKQARLAFGSSIDLERVKVAVASIPADLVNLVNGERPFTTMYVLNFASWAEVDMKTLIHELTHTWQGVVAGPVYMLEALHAQLRGEGYEVTNDMLRARGNQLSRFNREQQAVIVEEYWYEQWGKAAFPKLKGLGLDVDLLRPYAKQVFKPLKVVKMPLPLPKKPVPPIRRPVAAAARTARPRHEP